MNELTPTLWKTCRVLANAGRLSCLREVLWNPGLNVTALAHRLEISTHHASMLLRALQARGLSRPRRASRWVYYYPQPDPLLKSAAPILTALRKKFLATRVGHNSIIHILTAFTHPRRIAILAYLQAYGELSSVELSLRLNISTPALYRHLRKLIARGLVLGKGDYDCFKLLPTSDVLARTLLREVIQP